MWRYSKTYILTLVSTLELIFLLYIFIFLSNACNFIWELSSTMDYIRRFNTNSRNIIHNNVCIRNSEPNIKCAALAFWLRVEWWYGNFEAFHWVWVFGFWAKLDLKKKADNVFLSACLFLILPSFHSFFYLLSTSEISYPHIQRPSLWHPNMNHCK